MDSEPIRWRADELLAQADWLWLLARRLVDDSNAADDVVQDTWIAALRQPPRRERALRPWLARVARNVARMQRRGEASRKARESVHGAAGLDPDGARTPDELVARLEGQRLLVNALSELTEPYRSTILLAYFEHLTSEQIAARQGIAAGTVRWRLKVGLDTLREQLDRRHGGDRSAWSLALAPLVRSSSSTAGAASATALSLQGVLIMQTLLKAGVAAAALLIVLGGLSLSGVLPLFSGESLSAAPVAVTFKSLVAPEVTESGASVSSEREAVVAQPRTPAQSPVAVEEMQTASVDARFLDTQGRPLANVELRTSARAFPKRTSARSGPDGSVQLDLAIYGSSWNARLEAFAPGFAQRELEAAVVVGQVVHLGDIALAPGGDVSGRVIDEHSGPLAGALVQIDDLQIPQSELERWRRHPSHGQGGPQTLTNAAGEFTLRGVGVGFVRVVASDDDHLATFSGPVEVRIGQESQGVELVLERIPDDELITGRVLDPQGQPFADASVNYTYKSWGGSGSGSEVSGADGRFRLLVGRDVEHQFSASVYSARYGASEVVSARPGARDVVLRLQSPRDIELVVRAGDGAPVELFTASAWSNETFTVHGRTSSGPHADGRAQLRAGPTGFIVKVDAPGFALAEQGPFAGGPPDQLEFVLAALPGVRGQVLAQGEPIAGARVMALRLLRGESMEHNGFPVFVDPEVAANAASDAQGEFVLTVRERGRYLVRVEAAGFAPSELGPLDVDPQAALTGLVADMTAGGALAGRVIAPDGRSPAGMLVGISRGDSFAFTQRVGADGAFHAEHLLAGNWLVQKLETEIRAGESMTRTSRGELSELPSNCTIVEGATTNFVLDLAHASGASVELRGRLMLDGAAPGPWSAAMVEDDIGQVIRTADTGKLDAEGRFALTASAGGAKRVLVTAIGGDFDGMRLMVPLELQPGVNTWQLDLRSARATVENVHLGQEPRVEIGVVWIGEHGAFAIRPVIQSGTSELALPAGRLKLWRYDETVLMRDPSSWSALAEGTVGPGERTTLRAP